MSEYFYVLTVQAPLHLCTHQGLSRSVHPENILNDAIAALKTAHDIPDGQAIIIMFFNFWPNRSLPYES